MGRFFRSKTGGIALGSILAAGSLAVLMLACMAPTGRLGLTAVAGLFPMVGVLAAGRTVGLMCWAAAALLGLLLLPDKSLALLYLLFLGIYPVIKERLEGLPSVPAEWVLKLIFFNLILSVMWFFLRELFVPHLPDWMEEGTLAVYAVGNPVFVCYDIGLSQLVGTLRRKLRLY